MCTINFKTLIINKINQKDFIGWTKRTRTQSIFSFPKNEPFYPWAWKNLNLGIISRNSVPEWERQASEGKMLKALKQISWWYKGIRVEEKRKMLCCVFGTRSMWWLYRKSGAQCNYSYHREAVAVKKTANKNVFTWKIKCNFKVHDCYVRGWCVVFDKQ